MRMMSWLQSKPSEFSVRAVATLHPSLNGTIDRLHSLVEAYRMTNSGGALGPRVVWAAAEVLDDINLHRHTQGPPFDEKLYLFSKLFYLTYRHPASGYSPTYLEIIQGAFGVRSFLLELCLTYLTHHLNLTFPLQSIEGAWKSDIQFRCQTLPDENCEAPTGNEDSAPLAYLDGTGKILTLCLRATEKMYKASTPSSRQATWTIQDGQQLDGELVPGFMSYVVLSTTFGKTPHSSAIISEQDALKSYYTSTYTTAYFLIHASRIDKGYPSAPSTEDAARNGVVSEVERIRGLSENAWSKFNSQWPQAISEKWNLWGAGDGTVSRCVISEREG